MTLFDRILVANRGEIAIRIMRACRDLGIETVAVYGEDEQSAPHVRYASEAYRLDSDAPIPYLDIGAVLAAARASGAQAVHPGYGFLAENPDFAFRCRDDGFVFIGPSAESIEAMGDKIRAREIAAGAGVPVVPGSENAVDASLVKSAAESIGFPVALKAAAGGGGRGFRVALHSDELAEALEGASGEASRYFGDDRVYVERYLQSPRHIEIQVLADKHGNIVALGERDCSIQRRHQKLIEEAPSPALTASLRQRMEEAAIQLARAVDYLGAGTVEFLVQDDEFYFLEMNTRIQVEHPVTELITGVDLVSEQIRIASGGSLDQERLSHRHGHAIECRINAEDPSTSFQPVSGVVTAVTLPEGPWVRFDGVLQAGLDVSPRYDSLLGKLVVWGRDRDEAVSRLRRALSELCVEGVATTASMYEEIARHRVFEHGDYDTRFLERHPEVLANLAATSPMSGSDRVSTAVKPEVYPVEVNGRLFDVRVYRPSKARRTPPVLSETRSPHVTAGIDGSETIVSPIQGTVLSVAVAVGDEVRAGDVVCVVEAMKMENEISAGRDGVVARLEVEPGKPVEAGAVIAVVESGQQHEQGE